MVQTWIQAGNIPKMFDVSRPYAYQLVADMRKTGRFDKDVIKDGKITLVRISALERYWRERGTNR